MSVQERYIADVLRIQFIVLRVYDEIGKKFLDCLWIFKW